MSNRVAEYRARMRQRGYKEVRYWAPDTASPEFASRIQREARRLNGADRRDGMADFLDEIQADVLTCRER